jgi:hypothetical protein
MNCVLQDDVLKFISNLPTPPQPEDVPTEEKGKVKERREVVEGDNTVTIEDTLDDEDDGTLQERFQLRSRFSLLGLPNIPLIVKRPTSLEDTIHAPPRRPRNVALKRAAKKLKITETTNQKVGTATGVVEYFPMSTKL